MSRIVDGTIATNGPEAVSGTRVARSQPLVPQEKDITFQLARLHQRGLAYLFSIAQLLALQKAHANTSSLKRSIF